MAIWQYKSESEVTYSHMVTHTREFVHLPIQVHTHSSEHTQPFMLRRPGSPGSVPCSRAPRRDIEGGESAGYSLPPPKISAGPRLELATFGLRVRLSNH